MPYYPFHALNLNVHSITLVGQEWVGISKNLLPTSCSALTLTQSSPVPSSSLIALKPVEPSKPALVIDSSPSSSRDSEEEMIAYHLHNRSILTIKEVNKKFEGLGLYPLPPRGQGAKVGSPFCQKHNPKHRWI
jgi:hypothetical protein